MTGPAVRLPVVVLLHGSATTWGDNGWLDLLAEQFPPGPVAAIGFSLGARVLLTLAAENPGRRSPPKDFGAISAALDFIRW